MSSSSTIAPPCALLGTPAPVSKQPTVNFGEFVRDIMNSYHLARHYGAFGMSKEMYRNVSRAMDEVVGKIETTKCLTTHPLFVYY